MVPIDYLRNLKLNSAFAPPWEAPASAPGVMVPQGNTNFDPFLGSGWDRALDAMGASEPGGVNAAMQGLQSAAPQAPRKRPDAMQGQASAAQAGAFQRFFGR